MISSAVRTLSLVMLLGATASAQVVFESEGPFVPYTQNGIEARHGASPAPFSRVYMNVVAGQVKPATAMPDGTVIATNISGYYYTTLDFVFSVTSRLLMSDADTSTHEEVNALNQLKRAVAHVHAQAIAADKMTPLPTSRQDPSTLALLLTPSEFAFETGQSGLTPALTAALGAAATPVPILGPVASVMQSFLAARPQRSAPTFFSYQSADDEFGWSWYSAPGTTVEGTHRSSALLQVTNNAAYVRLTVELATDWDRFGVWSRNYSFLVPLKPTSAAR
jgi:hypothetical protein